MMVIIGAIVFLAAIGFLEKWRFTAKYFWRSTNVFFVLIALAFTLYMFGMAVTHTTLSATPARVLGVREILVFGGLCVTGFVALFEAVAGRGFNDKK